MRCDATMDKLYRLPDTHTTDLSGDELWLPTPFIFCANNPPCFSLQHSGMKLAIRGWECVTCRDNVNIHWYSRTDGGESAKYRWLKLSHSLVTRVWVICVRKENTVHHIHHVIHIINIQTLYAYNIMKSYNIILNRIIIRV